MHNSDGSRKYGLGLILAHQDMEQVSKYDSELANSIISNPGTRICFRVGDIDARRLEQGFAHFDSQDLQNLFLGQAIARVDTVSQDFNLKTFQMPMTVKNNREKCIEFTRSTYAQPRDLVEEDIFKLFQDNLPFKNSTPKIETNTEVNPIVPVSGIPTDPIGLKRTLEDEGRSFIDLVKERERNREHNYLQNLIKKWLSPKVSKL